MPRVLNIILTIVLLIILLGVLISAHEAGHFLFAKIFGVYCDEFSIGFGPKIFSKRRKDKETTFSLRAIPLGGYVAMYSAEDDEKRKKRNNEEINENDPDELDVLLDHNGNPVPIERSLEHKAVWKRIIILLAGVTVNFILSFVFCLIYAGAFPQYLNYGGYAIGEKSTDYETTLEYDQGKMILYHSNDEIVVLGFSVEFDESLSWEDDAKLYSAGLITNKAGTIGGYLIDSEASLTSLNGTSSVAAVYYPTSETESNDLLSCLSFYKNVVNDTYPEQIVKNTDYITKMAGFTSLPDMEGEAYKILEGDVIDLTISSIYRNDESNLVITTHNIHSTYEENGWSFASVKLVSEKYWAPVSERLENGCKQWVNFFPMMGAALKQLFRLNFDNVGGVIAMGASISQLSSYMGFGKTFFFYGGLISLNLGIINLFPFPGLDGWSILVALIETIFRRKIPSKAKRIMQLIGFGLLAAFAIFIMVKDIIRII